MKIYQVTLDNPDGRPEFAIYEVPLVSFGPENPCGTPVLAATIKPIPGDPSMVILQRASQRSTPIECSLHDAFGLFFGSEVRRTQPV